MNPMKGIAILSLVLIHAAAANPADDLEKNFASAPLRIMCVGDSITAGYTDNPKWMHPFEYGYRGGLLRRLMQAGYRVQFVGESPEPWDGRYGLPHNTPTFDLKTLDQDHHRGYGGWRTKQVFGWIGEWVSKDNPDLVLLMIGINDGGSLEARSNLEKIARTILEVKPAASLIIAQITPKAHFSKAISDYNQYIRETLVPKLVAEGKKVATVDQYENFLEGGAINPKLFANGINHPDAVAYDQMAQTWFEGIAALYPPPKVKE
jgi:lysophospholipase L1-like esterase